jgi:hypothetical protein
MPPADSDEPAYPISQSELEEYRQLDGRLRRDAQVLSGWRQSLIDRMGGPDVVEPGRLRPQVAYHDTGTSKLTEEGRVPIVQRHLVILDTPTA